MLPNENTMQQVFVERLLDPLTIPNSKPISWQRQKIVYYSKSQRRELKQITVNSYLD